MAKVLYAREIDNSTCMKQPLQAKNLELYQSLRDFFSFSRHNEQNNELAWKAV